VENDQFPQITSESVTPPEPRFFIVCQ